MGTLFLCLAGCFSMIILIPAVLSVLYASVLYFCICSCSVQLSMFHVERHSRNMIIVIIIIITIIIILLLLLSASKVYMLPHWDRICWLNLLSHPVKVTVPANQSHHWAYNVRCLAQQPPEHQFFKSTVWLDSCGVQSSGLPLSSQVLPLGHQHGQPHIDTGTFPLITFRQRSKQTDVSKLEMSALLKSL